MDANPCLLVFMLVLGLGLGLVLSHTTHVVEANEAVSAPSSADANVPSFDFPYKFKAVSKRLKSNPFLPTPSFPKYYVHAWIPPKFPWKPPKFPWKPPRYPQKPPRSPQKPPRRKKYWNKSPPPPPPRL
ncbi:hypothetical protein QUC31_006165 [Theobroma cacao]